MKSVLISIQPKWCELIASGKKTVEVRKTRPKIDTPFKCYIYCTLSGSNEFFKEDCGGDIAKWNKSKMALKKGKVIGEFVCNEFTYIEAGYDTNGNRHLYNTAFIEHRMCIPDNELFDYLYKSRENRGGWGWHISNLVIYDKPKELGEFHKHIEIFDGASIKELEELGIIDARMKRPPQSWCYIERLGEN